MATANEGARPRRRGRDLEGELLRAGREVFSRHGFDRVRVEDILEEAGVSRHSFYRFFDSKQDVLGRLTERVTRKLVTDLVEAVSATSDPATKVRSAVEIYLRWIRDLGPFHRVLQNQQTIPGTPQEAMRRQALRGLCDLLQREARPIVGDVVDDELLISSIIAAIDGIGRQMIERPERPGEIERLTEIALVILWRTLAQPTLPDTRSALE